ncbi:MAG: hypothetical protein Q7U53_14515 [Anaerolineaceae bacterium]|nr:hypothetical protein [Anaerolineaceae bacterium]
MEPELTIFTAPKPFSDPHISTIQYNAIRSWKELEPEVSIVLIGNEAGVESVAKELGVHFFSDVKRNLHGTPLISSIFEIGRSLNSSPLLAYVNADIILFSDFLNVSKQTLNQINKFLLVGQRWDMDILNKIHLSPEWDKNLKQDCKEAGRLHPRGGSDYFIYPRTCFTWLPDFAVGRAGWDNWMFYQARKNKWACVDASKSIQIIHQNHDYSHLPGGQSHYRLPETNENVRLAGGRRTIFTLMDVNYEFNQGKVQKTPLNWRKFWREVEIFPLISLKSKWMAILFFSIFHPKKAYLEFRSSDQKNKNDRNNYA